MESSDLNSASATAQLFTEREKRPFGLSKLPLALSKPWAARRGTPILQHVYLALHTSNTSSANLSPLAAYVKPQTLHLAAYNRI